jgi:hypothetical protein
MNEKELSEILINDYPKLHDEILYEIMAYYGQSYDNTLLSGTLIEKHGLSVVWWSKTKQGP